MGGRGTFAAGKEVDFSYKTVGFIEGVKVLEGLNGKHALPEESHTSEAYIKLKPSGIFHEMRIYGKDHLPIMDIAYHPEPNVDPSKKPVLHYHTYDKDVINRGDATLLTKELYEKYSKFFIGVPKK